MGYLISEMLPCLLLATLIGSVLGWLLRKCKKRDISYEEVSQQVVNTNIIAPKLKSEGLMHTTDNKSMLLEDEIVQLRLKLSSAELEAKTAGMKLSAIESDYAVKLKKAQESFYGRDDVIQSLELKLKELEHKKSQLDSKYALLEGEHESKLSNIADFSKEKESKVESLKEALEKAKISSSSFENALKDIKAKLERVNKSNDTLQEEKASLTKKYEAMQSEYNGRLEEVSSSAYENEQAMKALKSELEDAKLREKELENSLDISKKELQSLRDKLEHVEGELLTYKSEKSSLEEKIVTLKSYHDSEKSELEKRFAKMQNDHDSKLNNVSKSTKQDDAKLQSLQDKLSNTESQMLSFKNDKAALLDEVASLKSSLETEKESWSKKLLVVEKEYDAKLEEVRSASKEKEQALQILKSQYSDTNDSTKELAVMKDELERAKTKITTSQMKHKVMLNDYTGKLEAADLENERLRAELAFLREKPELLSVKTDFSMTKKPVFLKAPDGEADDLSRIKGIGGKLHTVLNDLGVYHFSQIAAWSSEEVAWVNEHLSFIGRIEREEWIKQAKALMLNEKDSRVEQSRNETKKETLKRHKHTKRLKKK